MTDWLVLPATLAQERELRGSPDGMGWRNLGLAWRIAGETGAEGIRAALAGITDRHEAMRTGLREVGGEVVQVVAPAPAAPVGFVDVSSLAGRRRARALRRAALATVRRPFRLAEPPLWRAVIVRLGAEHLLLVGASHTIWDAYSSLVLARELERPAARPAVQVGDVAAWERSPAAGDRSAYWKDGLGGARLALPIDRERAAAEPYRGRHVELPVLPRWTGRALATLARAEGTTPAAAFLAVFAVMLGAEAGGDVVVGVDEANRDRPETRELIGYLLDVMPLRVPLRRGATYRRLVGAAGRALAGAYRHRLPLRQLVALAPPGEPLYEATLNVRPYGLDPEGAAVRPFPAPVGAVDFPVADVWWEAHVDLSLDLLPSGAVRGELGYDAAALPAPVVERIAGAFAPTARRAARFPDRAAV